MVKEFKAGARAKKASATGTKSKVAVKPKAKSVKKPKQFQRNAYQMLLKAEERGERKIHGNSIYKPEFAEVAFRFALLGASEKQLATALQVNETTISDWKERHADFAKALLNGKDDADAEIANALYKRALEGDVSAGKYWLSQRQKHLWREQKEVIVNPHEDFVLKDSGDDD